MLCRNCNYILSGKENFCPNCGTIPTPVSQVFPTIKKVPSETAPPSEENKQPEAKSTEKKDFIFSDTGFFQNNNCIDSDTGEEAEDFAVKEQTKVKRKSPTAKALILLIICCTLATTAFALADYFGIIPDFSALASSLTNGTDKAEQQSPFNHSETVHNPEINYPMTTAYVLSGNGLTLRKGPGNGYAPLFNLTDLTQVQIFGGSLASTNWLYVYCGEKECYGWVDGSFLCSETVAESKLTSEYESYEEVPTAYYGESQEDEYAAYA